MGNDFFYYGNQHDYYAIESARKGLCYEDYRFNCWIHYYFEVSREAYNQLLYKRASNPDF